EKRIVVDHRHIDVVDRGVVDEHAVVPVAADIADAEITEAIVDAAVEAYARAPITGMPHVNRARPAPPARGPQRSHEGSGRPITGDPVVAAIGSPGPTAWHPDVARPRTRGLRIYRDRGRGNANGDEHRSCGQRGRRQANRHQNQEEPANESR